MKGRVHVIGAGLAGLSAAVHLSKAGVSVSVHETAKHAGGRCRSFYDDALGAVIDNGTHLLLSGNREVLSFLDITGGRSHLLEADRAAFDFLDLSNGARWRVDLGGRKGRAALLAWMFDKRRRPPNLQPGKFVRELRRLKRGRGKTVGECVDRSNGLYRTFWRPLTLAVLNAEPDQAAAELMWAVLRETVMKGGAFVKPLYAKKGLGAALVDPAQTMLQDQGVDMHFQRRITSLDVEDGRVHCVSFSHAAEILNEHDAVILAVPHHNVAELVSGVRAPQDSHAILNIHYKVNRGVATPRMLGLIGGESEWLFQRANIASVTISGANAWMDKDTDAIAHAIWPEVASALGEGAEVPAYRVIKERRATFAATTDALALRPDTRTDIPNLYLAGDWTNTGLPATIEGAVKSGRLAAEAVMKDWA